MQYEGAESPRVSHHRSRSTMTGGSRRKHKGKKKHRYRDDDMNSVVSGISETQVPLDLPQFTSGMRMQSMHSLSGHSLPGRGYGSGYFPPLPQMPQQQYNPPPQQYPAYGPPQYPVTAIPGGYDYRRRVSDPHVFGGNLHSYETYAAGPNSYHVPHSGSFQNDPFTQPPMPPPPHPPPHSAAASQQYGMNGQALSMIPAANLSNRTTFIRNFELSLNDFVDKHVIPEYYTLIESDTASVNGKKIAELINKLGLGSRHWRERHVSPIFELLEEDGNEIQPLSEGAALMLMVEITPCRPRYCSLDSFQVETTNSFLAMLKGYFQKNYTTKTTNGDDVLKGLARTARDATEENGVYLHLLQHIVGLNGNADEYDRFFPEVTFEILEELRAVTVANQSSYEQVLFATPPSQKDSNYVCATFPVEFLVPIASNLLSRGSVFCHSFLDQYCTVLGVHKRGWSRDGRVELQLAMQELAAAQYRSVEDALMNQEVPKIEVDKFLEKMLQCWSAERERVCEKLDDAEERLFGEISTYHREDMNRTFEEMVCQPIQTVMGREGVSEEQALKIARSVTRKGETKCEEICSINWLYRMLKDKYRSLYVETVSESHSALATANEENRKRLEEAQQRKVEAVTRAQKENAANEKSLEKLYVEVKELRSVKTQQAGEIRHLTMKLGEAEQKLKVAHAQADEEGGCCIIS